MDADCKKKAQERVDRITMFRAELDELEREDVLTLTLEQRSHLDTHHDDLLSGFQRQFGVDTTDSGKRVSWGMRIASLLGAAALTAALVLFLHRIWGHLPAAAEVAILTGAPLILLAGAETVFKRQADRYYVSLLALAAGGAFVMELSALGSVLNLADSPHVLFAWGLFAVLVANAYGLRLVLGAGLVLLCTYTAALVLSLQGYHWAGLMQRTQLLIPGALCLYCIPWFAPRHTADDFAFVYRACGAGIGFGALLLVSTSGDLCCGSWGPGLVEAAYQTVGLLLSVGVVVHGVRLSRKGLVNLGVVAFIAFLFIRLHAWWWQWMPKYLFFLLIGLIAVGLLLVFRALRTRLTKGAAA
jgi:hypothetical protein